ncbi:unnamed protein product [Paramecium primaurelia]|uniref:Uncharacterized protein n=1 Tax=Paramecium primaurelia TaxID=5886 RepID=A0A8S1Q130_PARPR|nr:unnamed protein product [Paramecium primaurelia]
MYKCLQVNHENEAIIGFCFNSKCQCASQYCIKCLIELHQGHQSDCIGLLTIPDFINKYISYQSQQIKNSKDIYFRVEKKIVSKMKRMDENIQNLKILDQALQNEDYIKLKSSLRELDQISYYKLYNINQLSIVIQYQVIFQCTSFYIFDPVLYKYLKTMQQLFYQMLNQNQIHIFYFQLYKCNSRALRIKKQFNCNENQGSNFRQDYY